ncbi:hypothetical protein NG791_20210 [Laspinema sp. D1]|nr:hypothetical protein [Laspinema sp. D2b]
MPSRYVLSISSPVGDRIYRLASWEIQMASRQLAIALNKTTIDKFWSRRNSCAYRIGRSRYQRRPSFSIGTG